jgi:serine/threonine-protein kinase/endoribonuclease IRE1
MLRVFILCAILLAWLGLSCLAETLSVRRRALATRAAAQPHEYPFRPPISGANDGEEDLQLMDIVLLASVDGKFHALNRTSGHTLWSMSSSAFPGSAPPTLGPLVRTSHVETDADTTDDDDSSHQELYIIEPQSGYIYIMTSPSSPLQRLAFSMSELVNMSPFSFSVGDDKRVFVGRKETSLFTLELETGKVKEVNAECPWNPFEDLHSDKYDIDLDELESSDLPRPITEISIGRTGELISSHNIKYNIKQ